MISYTLAPAARSRRRNGPMTGIIVDVAQGARFETGGFMRRKNLAAQAVCACACAAAMVLPDALATASAGPEAGPFTLNGSVIASGGGIGAAGCYVLASTIGEPVAGTSSGGGFTLTSGFMAGAFVPALGPAGDDVFRDGFEQPTGACQ